MSFISNTKKALPAPCAVLLLSATVLFVSAPNMATANPVPFFSTINDGRDIFDNTIISAGGSLSTFSMSGLAFDNTWALPGVTITSNDSVIRYVSSTYLRDFTGLPGLDGLAGGDGIDMTAGGVSSGLTFNFATPVNGFGLDLGDWATCCYPSSLYVVFDGGTPILVGTANSDSDNLGVPAGQGNRTFIGAIDDSNTFSAVTFYGDGTGDILFAGGVLRFGVVPLGSLSGSGYVEVASTTAGAGLANYFSQYDDTDDLDQIADYLDTLTNPDAVNEALKIIFPSNKIVNNQSLLLSSSYTSNILMSKVGTVLGNNTSAPPLNDNGTNNFNGADWVFANDQIATQNEGFYGLSLASSTYESFTPGHNAWWLQTVGASADGNSAPSTLGYDTTTFGFVSGIEHAVAKNLLVGIIGSYFNSDVDLDVNAGATKADNYNLGLYSQHLIDSYKITAMLSAGYGQYDSKRHISFGGINETPRANYNGWSTTTSLGLSRLYNENSLDIEPFANINYVTAWSDGFTEEGGGALNMRVGADNFSNLGSKLGVTFSRKFTANEENDLLLKLRPYIGHQWEVNSSVVKTQFVGATTAATINGRDATTFEAGIGSEVRYDFNDTTSLKVGADYSRDEFENRFIGFVGLGVKF